MKVKALLFLMFCSFALVACIKQDSVTNKVDDPLYVYADLLEKSVFFDDPDILNYPTDITCDNDYVYIVNQGNDNILVLKHNGEVITTFGERGQGQGELFIPEAIAVTKEYIYIVEKEGCRIQKFDKKFKCQNEINIDNLKNNDIRALDIEADEEGNVYLSVIGSKTKLLKIYKINKKNKVSRLGKDMIGVFGKDNNDTIYYAQSYQPIKDGYQDGEGFLGLVNSKIDSLFLLPYAYSPTSLSVSGDKVYLFSFSLCQIDEFTKEGDYVQTLYHEDPSLDNMEMKHFVSHQNDFYATDSKNNKIYLLTSRKNDSSHTY